MGGQARQHQKHLKEGWIEKHPNKHILDKEESGKEEHTAEIGTALYINYTNQKKSKENPEQKERSNIHKSRNKHNRKKKEKTKLKLVLWEINKIQVTLRLEWRRRTEKTQTTHIRKRRPDAHARGQWGRRERLYVWTRAAETKGTRSFKDTKRTPGQENLCPPTRKQKRKEELSVHFEMSITLMSKSKIGQEE